MASSAPLAHLFTRVDAHPLALSDALLKLFGVEYLGWEIEAVQDELRYETGSVPSYANTQKIQAARTVYLAESVCTEWEVFEKVTAGLFGSAPNVSVMQRPSPGRAGVALDVIRTVRDKSEIAPEVYKYCSAALAEDGLVFAPGVLEPACQYLRGVSDLTTAVRALYVRGANAATLTDQTLLVPLEKAIGVADFMRSVRAVHAEQKKYYGV